MLLNRIIYLCNTISDAERGTFYFADSALKKIRGYKKILEDNGAEVVTLSLSAPKKNFFRQRYQFLVGSFRDVAYYILRLFFEFNRLIKYMIYLTRERKNYAAIISYSYTTQNVLLSCFGYYFLGKRIILDYEDGLFRHRTRYLYYSLLEKIILKISSGCILVNEGLKKRLPANKQSVLINGIFIPQNQPIDEVKESGNGRITLLYSGELSFDYGLDLLFKVFLSANVEDIHFHITGSGKDEARLIDFISRHSLKNVFFHGYISLDALKDLEQSIYGYILMQNEDSPIYDTNFPSKLFHYLSSGKPVFLNHCSLFAGFEGFENAFAILNTKNSGKEIVGVLKDRKRYYPGVVSRMEAYNNDSLQKLKMVLFG